MSINTYSPLYTQIRRRDRAKDDAWIHSFLRRASMGTLATTREGQPFLVTRNFAFDESAHAIYIHGAMKGRTFENVQANPRVCFSVSEMGRLLPGDKAIKFGVEYVGVVIFGHASLVTDTEEATYGLQLLLDKYFPHLQPDMDYEQISDDDIKVTAVFRIDIESWSGKERQAADDFPGAFLYGEQGLAG